MKNWKLLCIMALVFLLLTGCIPNPDSLEPSVPNDPEGVLEAAMSALMEGNSEMPVFLGVDGTPVTVSEGTGLAAAITAQVSYTVTSVETEGETATATLEVTAPDAVQLVYAALEGMEEYDEETFTARLEALLADAQTKTYTVEVEMMQVEGQWLFVSNAELSNAITGGLVDEYLTIRQSIIDAFVEGGES